MDSNADKKKILIVEDDPILRKTLHETFVDEGFDVSVAVDGGNGLAMAQEKHPALILLDIVMPVMDGWTMLQKLRETNEWGKKVPVIVLTNLSSDSDEQMNLITKLEPSFFLVKSNWKIEEVVRKVRERLSL
jgi:DNA-binding response OmpR family regulator